MPNPFQLPPATSFPTSSAVPPYSHHLRNFLMSPPSSFRAPAARQDAPPSLSTLTFYLPSWCLRPFYLRHPNLILPSYCTCLPAATSSSSRPPAARHAAPPSPPTLTPYVPCCCLPPLSSVPEPYFHPLRLFLVSLFLPAPALQQLTKRLYRPSLPPPHTSLLAATPLSTSTP